MLRNLQTFVFGSVPDSVEGVGHGEKAGEDTERSQIEQILLRKETCTKLLSRETLKLVDSKPRQ